MVASCTPRVLIHASGRDGDLTCEILAKAGIECVQCQNERELLETIARGIDVLICAEEGLTDPVRSALLTAISAQPAWSDLPILVVAAGGGHREHRARLARIRGVSMIDRPMTIDTLVTAVRSAMQARRRQYEIRDLLHERERAAQRKDEFIAMLAHELRNPLAPIRYGMQILRQDRQLQSHSIREAVALVDRQVEHMANLIDDLLDVSLITSGTIELRKERLDLTALLRNVVCNRQGPAEAKGLELTFTGLDKQLWVDGDAVRLTQVFDNLIDNAEKFSNPGGQITIGGLADAATATLWINDNGAGIEADLLAHVFETFAQADSSLDRSKGGLGIGLALVSKIVGLHGGSVSAFSDGPGKGSQFVVHLPLAAEATALQPPASPLAPPVGASELKILIIEDNCDSAETLRMMLELYGHRVEVAHDGQDGIALAQRFHPDVVLCDIGLPGMSGYEVAQRLRREPRQPRWLVAITGYGNADDLRRSAEAGFDEHFVKPVDPTRLSQQLEKLASP